MKVKNFFVFDNYKFLKISKLINLIISLNKSSIFAIDYNFQNLESTLTIDPSANFLKDILFLPVKSIYQWVNLNKNYN